jgi:DNA-binding LacI/PurR family transcriptional regulator
VAEYGIRARRIGPFPPTFAGGRAAAVAFGDKPTTSVIGYNDLMSIGLMRELTRQRQAFRMTSASSASTTFPMRRCAPHR